jgi:hypothetical protein
MSTQKPTPQTGKPAPADTPEKPRETGGLSKDSAPAETGGLSKDSAPAEIGGRRGPEPTRYGDWENGGKCVDF